MFCQSKAGLIRNADLEMEVVPFLFLYLKAVTFDGRPAQRALASSETREMPPSTRAKQHGSTAPDGLTMAAVHPNIASVFERA
jgi:hypothetical protein